MTYKTNYELYGSKTSAYQSRRPSGLSQIDLVLAQAYPHVALQPYSYCCHCFYDPESEQSAPTSPASLPPNAPKESTVDIVRPFTSHGYGSRWVVDCHRRQKEESKKRKIRARLRRLLQRGCC